jgi:hypothetical protein
MMFITTDNSSRRRSPGDDGITFEFHIRYYDE